MQFGEKDMFGEYFVAKGVKVDIFFCDSFTYEYYYY